MFIKGFHHTEKTKRKISESHQGHIVSIETRKKISEAMKKNPVRFYLGKKLSEKHRKKISRALKGQKHPWANPPHYKGEKNPNWKGGISKLELYPTDWTDDLKKSIRERDSYICQMCGIHQNELNRELNVHHIDYNKDNLNPDNLISLCQNCHGKTNYNREYWIKFFRFLKNY